MSKYSQLSTSSLDEDGAQETGNDTQCGGLEILKWKLPIFSVVLNCVLALLCLLLYFRPTTTGLYLQPNAYETGFSTDFLSAIPGVETHLVQFTSALRFNETINKPYREYDPVARQYVGPPNEDIDGAWDDLLKGYTFGVSDEEAQGLVDAQRHPGTGHYYAELDVFHTLHCLNSIRKAVDKEYYDPRNKVPEYISRVHTDHCIDQVRQSIQCFGDVTPVPMIPYQNGKTMIGNSQVHTCRNFDKLRQWQSERDLGIEPLE